MEWTQKQILEALQFIEASEYDEVRLETDDFKLHVRKTGAAGALAEAAPPTVTRSTTVATPPAPPRAADTVRAAAPEEVEIPAGALAIRAPMVGTFYRAPAPHLPPFVEEQGAVKPEDTVCLIEVMKLFNTIKAGVAGKVVKICAQNAATVKKDQVLIIIEPQR